MDPARVVSSPLLRAVQTAEAIARLVGVRVVVEHGLIDRDYGQWAGNTRDELIGTWGSVDRAPGVEPAERVLYRASVVLVQQFDFLGARPVVLVSHDAVNRALLAHLDPSLGPASGIGQRTACWNELVHVMGDWRVTRVDQKPPVARGGCPVTRRRKPENPLPATTTPASAPMAEGDHWLTAGVVSVGAASLLSDSSHEMVTSLLPSFLTTTLGAGPAALGAIDGVADALTGVCKLAGGPLANDPARRGRLAAGGYLGTAVATAAIGLTVAVWQVAVLRAFAWASRGLRSPARDMLLTDLSSRDTYGRAFGVERAGDNAGAIIGPLLAAGLVSVIGIRQAMLVSFIPGLLAAVAITIAARRVRRTLSESTGRRTLTLNLGELRRAGLARVLTPVVLFELGNVATTLLILRATDLLQTGVGT